MKKKHRRIRKEFIITVISALVIIGLIVGLIIYFNKDQLVFNYTDNNEINIFDEVYNTDFITKIENGNILTEKERIDTSLLGTIEVKLRVEDNHKKEHEYKITIIVVDKEDPVITYEKEISTEVGTKIDLLKGVSATDNSKEDIEVTVEGEYDYNKEGEYKLYYVAKDSSGNVKKEEFTLKVTKKKEEPKKETTPTNQVDKTFTTSKGFKGEVKNGITYIDGFMIVNKTYSVPKSMYPSNPVKCNNNQVLNSTTCNAAKQMMAAAKEDGINLYIASGFRSYATQDSLWTKRKNSNGIEFADSGTARPGHSEHHTGLGFDMCGGGDGCITSAYANTPGAKWMAKNAYKFGLILRYPNGKTDETGYKYESWHFRYVGKELAEKLYNNGDWITLENYFGITSKYSD